MQQTTPGGNKGRLEFKNISKHYGPTIALANFTREFEAGKVHALMGKNGSGKSTLVKILSGAILPTAGEIGIDGELQKFHSPHDAFDAGVVTVYQELSLVPDLSVGENIFLGRLPKKKSLGGIVVDWQELYRRANELLDNMGLKIDARTLASSLSVGQQQVVEIVKAMSLKPLILLLDEPTSALASREVNLLFSLVRKLREQGVTVIYITHRMSELFEIADTCTVIRDGHYVGTLEMADTSHQEIVDMMFGETAHLERPPARKFSREKPVLEVRNIGREHWFEDVSFKLYPGEILGIAGLLGSGRTEIMRAIFGADRLDSGTIFYDGKEVRHPSPSGMAARGLGYTPENRKETGLVQLLSTQDNLCMSALDRIASKGVITRGHEKPYVDLQVQDLQIKVPDVRLPVASLSGGNQQKVVLGKWFNVAPRVMLFDEPSRGVDINAKNQIFEIIWKHAEEGLACIFVSTELEEVLQVAHRVLVISNGRMVAEVDPASTSLTQLYELCMEGQNGSSTDAVA